MAWGELATVLRRNGLSPDRPPWSGLSDESVSPSERDGVLQAIMVDLDERGNASAVVRALSAEPIVEARRLALEIAARTLKLDPSLIGWLRPVLRDRRLPSSLLVDGAAAALRTAGPNSRVAAGILRDFAAGFGRRRVLKNRHSLRPRLGVDRAFDRLCADLTRSIPLRCPRCGVRRRPTAMERHLWRRHHRLLVNGRVRSPLRWLDQLASQQAGHRDADVALDAVSRHFTKRQLKSADAESARQTIAERRSGVVCPHCAGIVPHPSAVALESVRPLSQSRNRLSGEGWIVERANHGIAAKIRMIEPDGAESTVENPAGRWSQSPATRWLVMPWVILAVVLAIALPPTWAILGTAIALTGAYGWRLLVRALAEPRTADALFDVAWAGIIKPRISSDEFPWSYAARLAVTSDGLGSAQLRQGALQAIVERSAMKDVSTAQRAALLGLLIRDADAIGDDPLPPVLSAVASALESERPIDELESIVNATPWRDWSAGRRVRFRVAIIERAFAAGLGVWELIEAGSFVPKLGEWIAADDLDGLARFRGLWHLRSDRGWEACGPAATAFELASYPVHEDTFAAAPDLLLEAPLGKSGERVWLRGSGMTFRGATISRSESIEARFRPMGRGFELRFGAHRIRMENDPGNLAHTLAAWSRYHFETLLPAMDRALGSPDGSVLERLLKPRAATCPECNGMFRARTPVSTHERIQ
jgi:hypothetical protein